jgi:hypothetical protein
MYLLFAVLYIPGEGFRPHQQQQTVGLARSPSGHHQNNELHDRPSLEKVG